MIVLHAVYDPADMEDEAASLPSSKLSSPAPRLPAHFAHMESTLQAIAEDTVEAHETGLVAAAELAGSAVLLAQTVAEQLYCMLMVLAPKSLLYGSHNRKTTPTWLCLSARTLFSLLNGRTTEE